MGRLIPAGTGLEYYRTCGSRRTASRAVAAKQRRREPPPPPPPSARSAERGEGAPQRASRVQGVPDDP